MVAPALRNAPTAAPVSGKTVVASIVSSDRGLIPALESVSSSVPGADSAYIPLRLRLGSNSGGNSVASAANTSGIPESASRVGMTTQTWPRETRRASASAATWSSANWKVLKPVTTSKVLSGQGNASKSPTRMSAPRGALGRDLDQLARGVDAGHGRPALGGQADETARAASAVEHGRARPDARPVNDVLIHRRPPAAGSLPRLRPG